MGRKFSNRQIVILVIIALADLCSAICISLQAPFFPAEAEKKGATATEYGLVFGIFELVVFLVSPIYGQYISKIGPKFMFNAGIFITGSTCILFGFLNHIATTKAFVGLAFAVRIVEAMGNAGFLTASFSIIAKEFPDNVGSTFAALETCFGVGLIVGPTVGGALYEVGGYTLPFLCMGSLLLLAASITACILPNSDLSSDDNLHGGANMVKLFKIPAVCLFAFAIIAASISIGFIQATLEPHLRPLGLSAFQTGLVFVLNGAAYALSAPIWGKLCDKGMPERLVTFLGSLIVVAAFLMIGPAPFLPLTESLPLNIGALVLHGVGFGAQLVATFTGAHKDAIKSGMADNLSTYGVVSGMWTSTFALGAFIGPSSAGVLQDYIGFDYACMFVVALHAMVAMCLIFFACCTSGQSSVQSTGREGYTNLEDDEETRLNKRNPSNRASWDSSYGSLPSESSSQGNRTTTTTTNGTLTMDHIFGD